MRSRSRSAFFDVDNTLLNLKSMFSFQQYYYEQLGGGAAAYDDFLNTLMTQPQQHDRLALNRLFYQSFEGRQRAKLSALAWHWFDALCKELGPSLWIRPAIELAQSLREKGYQLVAVSGSCHEILTPLIQQLRFDACLATKLEVNAGFYTGHIESVQMIGDGKAVAIRQYAESQQIDLRDCIACGDHITDLAMLEIVGEPWIVAGDPHLEEIAAARRWPVLAIDASATNAETIHV